MSRGLLAKVGAVGLSIVLGAGIGLLLVRGEASGANGVARSWIDHPLDRATVAPGIVVLVAHSYDPTGVEEVTLLVDGVVMETRAGSGATLETTRWQWRAASEGTHLVEIHARGTTGTEGGPGLVTIIVAEPDEDTTTTTRQTTTTVPTESTTTVGETTTTTAPMTTTTSAPTTTSTTQPTTTTQPACSPPAPVLLSPSDGARIVGPSPSITLRWSGWRGQEPSCLPSGFRVEVSANAAFTQIVAQSTGPATFLEWTPPTSTWACNTARYWRVWSLRSDGTASAVSPVWRVDVICG